MAPDGVDEGSTPPAQSGVPVVGIGASAGGLTAFTRLLSNVATDTGYAFVLVQHLDASHPSSLSEILGRATSMPVAEATDGTPVEPDRVYVIPPNAELTIVEGNLRLTPRRRAPVAHMPIDQFLRSLAEDRRSGAIGVILSGAGSDGAAGLLAIKEAGGVTFVQEPATADFPSMPTMAAAAGGVDFILDPERIAARLAQIAKVPRSPAAPRAPHAAPTADLAESDQLRAICDLMHEATGIDFALYREKTIVRRIMRRLTLLNLADLGEYARLLAADPTERTALQRDLLIGVTKFFREPESFDALKRLVFPVILADRPKDTTIRIWVPGCASGEEPYSILIALQEYQSEHGSALPVLVFASDISDTAIEKARAGRYPETIATDVSPERLDQHFTRVEGGYQIAKRLRERCVFSRHNLLDDPPFSKLDLISCRNVLIYLDAVQKQIIPLFHYALEPHGFLMLGQSETAHFAELFAPVEPRLRIYSKLPVAQRHRPLPRTRVERRGTDIHGIPAPTRSPALRAAVDPSREADRILLSRYSPAGVLVDERLEVLEIRGRTEPFLALPTGKVGFHLLKFIPDTGLFLEVERLVQEAAKSGEPARRERVAYETDGRIGEVSIEVTPLHGKEQRNHLILFEAAQAAGEDTGEASAPADRGDDPATARDRQLMKLKQELADARERLLLVIEEHETEDQDNQQVTEDALSANEELQSLTEELETAKEELQSTNEELITVNRDLESRNLALESARDFARSIVETVGVPLVVTDGALTIRTVNPSFARAFRTPLGEAEGRSLYEVSGGAWDVPELRALLDRVLPRREPFDGFELEREFPSVGARTLIVSGRRLEPLELILLTIEDVTEQRKAERALRSSEEQRRQAEKMEVVGRLAGGIAHDFNNLLTVIIGYCHLLAETLEHDAEASEQLDEIRRSVEKAVALTDQLLAFSQRKILQPKIIDLNPVIVDFERMLRRLLGGQIKSAVHCAPDLWKVRADPGEIGRVVMNLSLNARDAMPGGGTLTIQTGNVTLDEAGAAAHGLTAGRYVRLEVRDTGIGMDEEMLAHVFEPFFTTKEASQGAGLGLPTVLGIVQQSGGAISCASEVARGTQFTILLPASPVGADVAERARGRVADAPRGSSELILLVEDENSVRALARRILETAGYLVLEAADGREAVAKLETHPETIDLLVTDVVLPELGGREVAERAVRLRPDLKVLFVSAHTEDVILKEGVTRGMPFLQKPFSPSELARKVREVLDSGARST